MRKGNLMGGTVNLGSKEESGEISRSHPLPGKGVGSVELEECGQIWAKFGPYIELWVNIPSLCGSHLGKMDPLASPNYAWQGRQGGKLKMWELYQVPKVFFLSLESALWVGGEWKTPLQLISNSFLCISLGGTKRVVEKSISIQLKLFLLSSCLNDMVFNKNRQPVLSNQFRIN